MMWIDSHQTCKLHNGMLDDTIQGEMTNGNLVFVDSKQEAHQFKLLQYHLHAPSEHLIGGKQYDLELHLVHKRLDETSAKEELGVVAIFFDVKAGGN